MAYSTSSPPVKLVGGLMGGGAAGRGGNVWYYMSTDDDDTVIAANYFTNAVELGMQLGDLVIIVESDHATPYQGSLATVSVLGDTTTALAYVVIA